MAGWASVAMAIACGNAQPTGGAPGNGGEPGTTLSGAVGDQAEFERFAKAAALDAVQRANVLKFLLRYERHYLALNEARPDFVTPLNRHIHTLVLSELSPKQAALFDQSNLPGSKAFHAPDGR